MVYLENPVGLRGTDPMIMYARGEDGTHPALRKVDMMFQRGTEFPKSLMVPPEHLTQDILAVWTFMEHKVLQDGLANALGLKHFNARQIKSILREAREKPKVA